MAPRRLTAPWRIEDLDACFKVSTADGLPLAYIYFETTAAHVGDRLTKDEARRVAAQIARIPELLSK